jgi:hypothetical protein
MRHRLVVVEVFGVTLAIEADDAELLAAALALLPPGHARGATGAVQATFTLARGPGALADLDARVRRFVATHAPDHVFVHAGVVAHRERAIVLPAATFAGKSELVAALVRAGAAYCSDEYAAIDRDGLVHPYARPLTLRPRGGGEPVRLTAAELGGRTQAAPLPVGLIAATSFAPGARWAPAERTPAAGALLLLAHAGRARDEPARVLDTVQRAAAGARVLEGPRGEAGETARALLA